MFYWVLNIIFQCFRWAIIKYETPGSFHFHWTWPCSFYFMGILFTVRYSTNLVEAKDFGIRKGLLNGVAMGLIFLVMFGTYGLAFWYGSQLVIAENEPYSAGTLLIVSTCLATSPCHIYILAATFHSLFKPFSGSGTALCFLIKLMYNSPSILQPSILRPPFIIRPLDFGPKGQFSVLNMLNNLYFKTTCNIRPHFLGPMGGLKIEGPL